MRDIVEERSHVKLAITINVYPEWLINSIPTRLYIKNLVNSDDTKGGVQEVDI